MRPPDMRDPRSSRFNGDVLALASDLPGRTRGTPAKKVGDAWTADGNWNIHGQVTVVGQWTLDDLTADARCAPQRKCLVSCETL